MNFRGFLQYRQLAITHLNGGSKYLDQKFSLIDNRLLAWIFVCFLFSERQLG